MIGWRSCHAFSRIFFCQRKFYGPVERWANIPSLLSLQSINAAYKAFVRQVPGNFEGEGRLLGGKFILCLLSIYSVPLDKILD